MTYRKNLWIKIWRVFGW